MSDSLADEYDRLTRPEFYRKIDEVFATNAQVLAAKSELAALYLRISGGDLSESKLMELQRARYRDHLSQFDDAILLELKLTVDDLIAMHFRRIADRRAGRIRPQSPERRETRRQALLAIRRADSQGLGWTESIEFVQGELSATGLPELDRKTIDRWLRELHEWRLIEIAPPQAKGRGRPRKKE
jgi:hypothetical protein